MTNTTEFPPQLDEIYFWLNQRTDLQSIFLDSDQLGLWILDVNQNQSWINSLFWKKLGYHVQPDEKFDWQALIHPDDLGNVREVI